MIPVLQAGAVVFRADEGAVRLLLVRSRKNPGMWVFPKGHIDPGETSEETAQRETEEEAGVTSELLGRVGATLSFQSGGEWVEVDYFLARRLSEYASPEGREKIWVPPGEAIERLSFENARELVRAAIPLIDSWRRASGLF
jgi:8-oxo-dGTP pyrophosphatase MutT (NUDIX family)